MVEGYARFRPPVHPLIIRRIGQFLRIQEPFPVALDIGCGTGLSTRALKPLSHQQIGIEPSRSMLAWASSIAPDCFYVNGTAEILPFANCSIDLITAAGSLNWLVLHRFFTDASRILKSHGLIVVYDFGPGREFTDSELLSNWFKRFVERYPIPFCPEINSTVLQRESIGFRLHRCEDFQYPLTMAPGDYLNYILTETNVDSAIQKGISRDEIRRWCKDTLNPIFQGTPQTVLFRGFIACLARSADSDSDEELQGLGK
jgi:SAM-dependent methyltransferase